ncbi:4'-phosphopantetheinyl transferase family protein [Serinibacter arcticus]|uniref:4'-phosphopantetheinyl transferase n=1 Tax=Serinibacter arcticus TaxID=1655435 RepID=A0A4Z1DYN9_9MICO|nr:4'-phosphopantetheinyl transferase superfamily protein [Serinibacter arcticus]TGO04714.1 4'-phosphopantetheinyl transferase [Serinibacter arcticus]
MITLLDASVTDVLAACARLTGAEQLVDDVDRAAAARRRRPEDSRRTLAGRAALRLLVAARTGRPAGRASEIVIDRRCRDCGAPHGQPRTAGLSLSTSGSGERVLVAVAPGSARVGVDVEAVTPTALGGAAGLDDYALHPDERADVVGTADADRARMQRWVEKEAVLKAAGLGLTLSPNAVRLAPQRADRAAPTEVSSIGPADWRGVLEAPVDAVRRLVVVALPGRRDDHPGRRSYLRAVAAAEVRPIRAVDVDLVTRA